MAVAARPAGPAKRANAATSGRAARGKAPARPRKRREPAKARGKEKGRSGTRSAEPRPTRAATPVVGGVLWAAALVGAVAVSSILTAVLLGVVAAVATASGMRATEPRPSRRTRARSRSRRPAAVVLVALAGALADPIVALAGPYPAIAALLVSSGVVTALVLPSGFAASARPLRTSGSRLVAALAPALAATSLVVARHQGTNLAVALVAATLAYDTGAFLMGNSRTPQGGPVGVVFGIMSVTVVAVFVAAVMNPPFIGSRPWVVFALTAAAAAIGVRLGQLVGEGRLPALRRVDSLFLAAPVWVVSVALVVHR